MMNKFSLYPLSLPITFTYYFSGFKKPLVHSINYFRRCISSRYKVHLFLLLLYVIKHLSCLSLMWRRSHQTPVTDFISLDLLVHNAWHSWWPLSTEGCLHWSNTYSVFNLVSEWSITFKFKLNLGHLMRKQSLPVYYDFENQIHDLKYHCDWRRIVKCL